jgi:hypothetical protein
MLKESNTIAGKATITCPFHRTIIRKKKNKHQYIKLLSYFPVIVIVHLSSA